MVRSAPRLPRQPPCLEPPSHYSHNTVHSGSTHECSRDVGRNLDPTTFTEALADFFSPGPEQGKHVYRNMAAAALADVEAIIEYFETQTALSFVGTSMLFLREGDAATIAAGRAAAPVVRMIDFAHTKTTTEKDLNYLAGARNAWRILKAVGEGDAAVGLFIEKIAQGTAFASPTVREVLHIKGCEVHLCHTHTTLSMLCNHNSVNA